MGLLPRNTSYQEGVCLVGARLEALQSLECRPAYNRLAGGEMAKQEVFDAIIVGSGATGGWAAKELTEAGMRVIVLEAGRKLDPEKDFTEHKWPYELKFRGQVSQQKLYRERQPVQSKCYACDEYGHQIFIDDIDNPYTTPSGKPFEWIRAHQVAGG